MSHRLTQHRAELITELIEPSDTFDVRRMKKRLAIDLHELRLIEHRSYDGELVFRQLDKRFQRYIKTFVNHSSAAKPEKSPTRDLEIFLIRPRPHLLNNHGQPKNRLRSEEHTSELQSPK